MCSGYCSREQYIDGRTDERRFTIIQSTFVGRIKRNRKFKSVSVAYCTYSIKYAVHDWPRPRYQCTYMHHVWWRSQKYDSEFANNATGWPIITGLTQKWVYLSLCVHLMRYAVHELIRYTDHDLMMYAAHDLTRHATHDMTHAAHDLMWHVVDDLMRYAVHDLRYAAHNLMRYAVHDLMRYAARDLMTYAAHDLMKYADQSLEVCWSWSEVCCS